MPNLLTIKTPHTTLCAYLHIHISRTGIHLSMHANLSPHLHVRAGVHCTVKSSFQKECGGGAGYEGKGKEGEGYGGGGRWCLDHYMLADPLQCRYMHSNA